MFHSSVLLFYVFKFLEPDDLVHASAVSFYWWQVVFGLPYFRKSLWEEDVDELDLTGSGRMYRYVPVNIFSQLTTLRIGSTDLTTAHFRQIVRSARDLDMLDVSNCRLLDKKGTFSKLDMRGIEHLDISNNPQFSIKTVIKLCLLPNLTRLVIKGIEMTADELSFLLQNVRSISCGRLVLERRTWPICCCYCRHSGGPVLM